MPDSNFIDYVKIWCASVWVRVPSPAQKDNLIPGLSFFISNNSLNVYFRVITEYTKKEDNSKSSSF